jgi:hypothetical protein
MVTQMERLTISTQTAAVIGDFKSTYEYFDPDGLIYEGSNLVVDDHLILAEQFAGVVLGGEGGAVWFCIPDADNVIMPINLIDVITDRAGPNGQTMPVFDEVQAQARMAKAAAANPKEAARAEHREERAHRRELKEVLREAIAKLPHDQQKHARQVLRAKGVLGKDD